MGGWGEMMAVLEANGELSKVSMLRPHGDPDGMPWYAILLGYPVLGIWYWCADQTIVQRVLGAQDENHARVGPLFAGLIKILPVFIFVLPDLLAYMLASSGKLDLSSITSAEGVVNSKGIYAVMITELLPAAVAIALVPMLNQASGIFNALSDIIAHIAPPVTTVFLLGVFWKKTHGPAAQWTMIIGGLSGVLVFALNKLEVQTPLLEIPFMMMAFYLFCYCVALQTILTCVIQSENTEEAKGLCWNSPLEPLAAKGWSGIGNYKFLAALLIAVMGTLYYFFR